MAEAQRQLESGQTVQTSDESLYSTMRREGRKSIHRERILALFDGGNPGLHCTGGAAAEGVRHGLRLVEFRRHYVRGQKIAKPAQFSFFFKSYTSYQLFHRHGTASFLFPEHNHGHHQCLVGFTPFYADTPVATCRNILNWQQHLDLPEEVAASLSAECIDFMFSLINDTTHRYA